MTNILLALVCLAIGKSLQHARQFPASSAQVLNLYVIYVALPALILVQIPKVTLSVGILAPVIIAWLVMGLAAGVTWLIARYLQWSRVITGAMLLVVTLGNTSFIGIPLVEAHLGAEAIPYAIIYDQLGSFIALNTLGIAIASRYSEDQHAQQAPLWLKILKFPPFGALLCGFALGPVAVPLFVADVLHRLADTLVPVVMVAVGLQWRLRIDPAEVKLVAFALVLLLLVKPLFAWLMLQGVTLEEIVERATLLEAAMPAMISTSALAVTYGIAPRFVATVVGYSLMFSFLTVWLWSVVV